MYIQKDINLNISIIIKSFILALLLNSAANFGPYLMEYISENKIRVIGFLNKFEEQCSTENIIHTDFICNIQYKIPLSKFNFSNSIESIGLGFIQGYTEAYCGTDTIIQPLVFDRLNDGNILHQLNEYIIFHFRNINCSDNLIIKIWTKLPYLRYGHTNAPAVIGSQLWVEKIKYFCEFFRSYLLLFFAFIFCLMKFLNYKIFTRFKRQPLDEIFDEYLIYFLFFTLIGSGIFGTVFTPTSIGHNLL